MKDSKFRAPRGSQRPAPAPRGGGGRWGAQLRPSGLDAYWQSMTLSVALPSPTLTVQVLGSTVMSGLVTVTV